MLSNTGWHVPPFWHITFKHGFYGNKRVGALLVKGKKMHADLSKFTKVRLQYEHATRHLYKETSFKLTQTGSSNLVDYGVFSR